MSRNRRKGKSSQQPKTRAAANVDGASQSAVRAPTGRTSTFENLRLLNTQLGASLFGGIVVLALSVGLNIYQAQVANKLRLKEKIDEERVAVTKEVSTWAFALSDAANQTFLMGDKTSGAVFDSLDIELAPYWGVGPETQLMQTRLVKAFGDTAMSMHQTMINNALRLHYVLRDIRELRAQSPPDTAGVHQIFLRGDFTRPAGEIVKCWIAFTSYIRARTYGEEAEAATAPPLNEGAIKDNHVRSCSE